MATSTKSTFTRPQGSERTTLCTPLQSDGPPARGEAQRAKAQMATRKEMKTPRINLHDILDCNSCVSSSIHHRGCRFHNRERSEEIERFSGADTLGEARSGWQGQGTCEADSSQDALE